MIHKEDRNKALCSEMITMQLECSVIALKTYQKTQDPKFLELYDEANAETERYKLVLASL